MTSINNAPNVPRWTAVAASLASAAIGIAAAAAVHAACGGALASSTARAAADFCGLFCMARNIAAFPVSVQNSGQRHDGVVRSRPRVSVRDRGLGSGVSFIERVDRRRLLDFVRRDRRRRRFRPHFRRYRTGKIGKNRVFRNNIRVRMVGRADRVQIFDTACVRALTRLRTGKERLNERQQTQPHRRRRRRA